MRLPRKVSPTAAALLVGLSLTPSARAVVLNSRVFVSARSGNDTNACNNILTPCQTFAGAVLQLSPGGEAIVLDSGGYGPVTITQSLTIEAPPGVVAFIHPSSGNAITISAGATDVVILRGLILNGGSNVGINVSTVGTLNVENCVITGFANSGILMTSAGVLNVEDTNIKRCLVGVFVQISGGTTQVLLDHSHLDQNSFQGYRSETTSPGSLIASALYTTANGNIGNGWISSVGQNGQDVLELEFCTGTGNGSDGLGGSSPNSSSLVSFSNCVFSNNGGYGVNRSGFGPIQSRGNNSITGNVTGPTFGTLGSFLPM